MLKLFSLAPFGSATSESLKERPRSQRANKPPSQLTGGVTLEMRAKFRRRERVWSLLSVLFCLNQPPSYFLVVGTSLHRQRVVSVLSLKRTCMKQFRLVKCQLIETKLPLQLEDLDEHFFLLHPCIRRGLRLQHCSGDSAVPRLQSTSSTTMGFVDVLCH